MGPLQRSISVLGELFITAGVVILLFLGWQLWWTDVEADSAQASTVTSLERTFRATAAATGPTKKPAPEVVPRSDLLDGDAFAVLRVPRFGADYARPIVEGTGHEVLDRGIGHYKGTQMPGEIGNFALAGHRVTYGKPFNRIAELQPGDRAIVETAWGWFVYKSYAEKIVLPSHGQAIEPVPEKPGEKPTKASMVFTACHPMFSARERYVEYLELEAKFPRAKGLPAQYLKVGG